MTEKQNALLRKLGLGEYVINWIDINRSSYVSKIIDFIIKYKKDGTMQFYKGIKKTVPYDDNKHKELKELILKSDIRHYNDEGFNIHKVEGLGVDNLYHFYQSYVGDWGNFKGCRFGYIIYQERDGHIEPSIHQVWGLGITIMAMKNGYDNSGLHATIDKYLREVEKE